MEAIQSHHLMKRTIDSNTSSAQDCLRSVASPKPNQVGTVLLYGIPIVSLYIESQERLCLAQISNTLLKQFSYNEIHNRRVALGITCVQCTPVQLEILRRAGAMPVSSRRCGMITRREAERLCKSFLGDNAPPRLPDDFAFSVHHECAWGCRGSFLPSRYNSSRAKCIKCSYCGLFFSPNKFIFHSHRIGPGDKYVQPDAANFNSWRRHMKLSGEPPEEITHAWEDVKAMFNGGTRKRLMTTSPNNSNRSEPSPKRIKDSAQIAPPLIHAAAAAAVASATANTTTSQFPIRPINIHHPVSVSATNSNQRISNLSSELQLPFSRTFMMDYMWHHTQNKSNPFQFPNYALPWMKRPGSLLFGQQHTLNDSSNNEGTNSSTNSADAASGFIHLSANTNHVQGSPSAISTPLNGIDSKTLPTFYNNSAFKPVINHQGRGTFQASVAAAAAAAVATTTLINAPTNDDRRSLSRNSDLIEQSASVKESHSSDDEMVDIETTEEEQQSGIDLKTATQCFKFRTSNESSSPPIQQINIKIPPSSPSIEIENSTETVWDGFLKKEHQTSKHLTNLNGGSKSTLGPIISTTDISHPSPSSSASSMESNEHQSTSTVLLRTSPSSATDLCCNIFDNNHHHQSIKKAIFNPATARLHNLSSSSSSSSLSGADLKITSRIIAAGTARSPSLPPPPPPSVMSTHSLSSPSTSSSTSTPNLSSVQSSPAPITSSPSSSAAVVAAAAAAAVAIAAFNTTHQHHHQHNQHHLHHHHHHHHNQQQQHQHSTNTINSIDNNCNSLNAINSVNCNSTSSILNNIAAVAAVNNQRIAATNAVAAAAAAVATVVTSNNNNANNSNNGSYNITNNLNNSNNDSNNEITLHSSQNFKHTTNSNHNCSNNNNNSNINNNNNNNNNSKNNNNNNNNNDDNCITNNSAISCVSSNIGNNNNSINAISNNNNISSKNNTNNNNNNNSNSNASSNNNGSNNSSSNTNNEFWSVARFSFEPPTEYRLSSFYRHDITKHFQTFRHGETTTQTNGIG